jgi:hypothetical protein
MENLAAIVSSPIFNFVVVVIVLIAQLYIANKITPIKKDIEFLKESNKDIDESLKELYKRCYENHREHRK